MKKTITIVLAVIFALTGIFGLTSCNGNNTGADVVKVIDIPLTEEYYAFAVQKGNSEMLGKLNAFLTEIKANGKFDEVMNKYFGDGTPTAVASASTMKTDGSQLIVATNAAFEPFEYKNGENYYGVDMELMSLFADSLGKELYINNMEFDAVCLSVSALGGSYTDDDNVKIEVSGGICDIAAAGLTVNTTRMEILDFTDTYYSASQMIITAASDTTFDNCNTTADVEAILNGLTDSTSVGVQNGTTGKFYCEGDADWGYEGFDFKTIGYSNGALAVQNIINGNVKYVVIDEGPAKAIVKRMNNAN